MDDALISSKRRYSSVPSMPIVDGFEANRILQSVTFGSNKEHTIATDNYASAREWIGVKGRNLLPPSHRRILRYHLPVTIHSKCPSSAPQGYTAGGYNRRILAAVPTPSSSRTFIGSRKQRGLSGSHFPLILECVVRAESMSRKN